MLKKFYLIIPLLTAFLWLGTGRAWGDELTVSDGTNKNPYVPLYGNWADAYQHFQVIYPATDLAEMTGKQITSMKFYIASTSTVSKVWNGTFKIRLAETESTYFNGAFINITSAPVYTGSLDGRTREVLITFTEAYTYNGGNLLFDLQDETSGDNYNDASFLGVGQGYNSAVGSYSSTSVAAVTATNRTFIPKTTFTYEAPSSCAKPTDLTKGTITANSASFSWTAGGSESEWQYLCLPADEEANWEGSAVKTATSASVTVEDLNPSTAYKFYARANCGGSDGQSAAVSVAFKTPCVAISALPASFNFDNETVDEIPDCWGRIAYESSWYGTMPKVYSSGAYGGSGKCIYFYGGGSSSSAAIILPAFEEKTGKLAISFQYNNGNTYASYGFAQIGYMTDPADASTFVMLKQLDKVDAYTSVANYPLTGAPDNAYIAIRYAGGSSDYGSLYIDNITVDLAPSCLAPSAPTASDITTNSAKLTWTANSGESAWTLQYSTDGETWTDKAVSAKPYTLEGLSANTLYYVRVKAKCGATDESSYGEIASFRTTCGAISTLPWKYGFEDATDETLPACWNSIPYDYYGTDIPYVDSYSTANNGSKYMYFYGGGASSSSIAILPEFEESISGLVLSFYYKNSSVNANYAKLKVGYITDPSDASSFVAVETLDQVTTYAKVGPFAFTGAPAGAHMAIQFAGGSQSYGSAYLDDITVDVAPSCMLPSGVKATSVTDEGAVISWTAGGSETAWTLQYKRYDGDWSADINVTTASYTLTGLDANTNYYVRVKAVCGVNEESDWTSSINFKTACGVSSMPFEESFSSSSALPSCWNAPTPTSTTYRWKANSEYVGGAYNYMISLRGSSNSAELSTPSIALSEDAVLKFRWKNGSNTKITANVYISIDGGATRELLPNDLSTKVTSWTNKTIDLSDYTGETVIIYFVSATGNSINSYAYLDDVQVIAKPCEGPTGLAAAPTVDGGTISWIGSAKALRYKTGDAEWTKIAVSGNSHTLTSLQAETAYQVQVQAACAASDDEAWSASLTFTTKCAPSNVLPYENNFENEALNEIPTCWDRISASAYPQVVSGAAAYGGSGKALYFYGNTNQTAVLPALTADLSTLSFSLYYKGGSANFQLGYVKADGVTFVALETLPALTAFGAEPYELDLASIPAEAKYLAIRYSSTSNYASGYVDNVVVRKTPTCFKPASAEVESYTDNSAVINWTASGKGETQYQYVCVPANTNPDWDEATLTDQLTATVENLTAHKAYDFYVRSYCDDEQSDALKVSFTTACSVISASPWEYDFENDAAWGFPECWNKFEHGYSGAYVVDNSGKTAPQSLYVLGGTTDSYATVILPKFAAALNTLAISFQYSGSEGDAYGKMKVGYMTNIENESSFVVVKEFAPADAYKQAVVSFAGISADANITIQYVGGSSEGDLYIDDIRVARTEVFNDSEENQDRFAALKEEGTTIDVLFNRTLLGNGDYNTFCLPFNLNADQLEGSPIANFKLKAYDFATIENEELLIAIAPASSIKAGVPYFIANNENEANLTEQLFKDVVIAADAPSNVPNGDVTFQGVFNPVDLAAQAAAEAHTQLFLAAGNMIYWPAQNKTVKGFRAYFEVNVASGVLRIQKGMPVRIVEHTDNTTGIENVQGNNVQSTKILENKQVVIIRNGVKYNVQGQVISK